ncbi:MAG: helix-turn-helix transcriptional regulator [Microcoleus sp. SIO2G3]|nr:helix-turn-helix transcriptional regulator [Microcoleus sp. SIO2G3]
MMVQETAFTEEGLRRLAEIIKTARGERNSSEFAKIVGINYMTIIRLENCEVKTPKISTLQKLERFTPFSWEELLAIGTGQSGATRRDILTADDVMPYVTQLPLTEIGRLIQKLGEIVTAQTNQS